MSNQIADLAQQEESRNKRKRPAKQVLLDETKKFVGIFVYLVIVFGIFVLH